MNAGLALCTRVHEQFGKVRQVGMSQVKRVSRFSNRSD
jgi:hypothetical protein